MNHFCSYCDVGYVARLVCLHDSLLARGEPFRLHVLCFDRKTEEVVAGLGHPSLAAVPLAEFRAADPGYAQACAGRSRAESFFTATAALVGHCLDRVPEAGRVTYLDADMYFHGPPSAVFAEQGDASIGIVAHRFPARLAALARCGTYNVAWVSIRRDPNGLACVRWWRERCLEWCHDFAEDGKYADQGYLDEFPHRFAGVRVLDHPGINAAPWNMGEVSLTERDGRLLVNDRPLLFYHFQGLRELLKGWFDPGLKPYQTPLTPALRELVYQPYVGRLAAAQDRLARDFGIQPSLGHVRLPAGGSWRDRRNHFLTKWIMPRYRRWRGELLHCPAGGPR